MIRKLSHLKDYVVFKDGSPSDCAYLIETGTFEIFCLNNQGVKQVIGILDQDSIFGEMGLIDGKSRSATVKALSKIKVTVFNSRVLQFT